MKITKRIMASVLIMLLLSAAVIPAGAITFVRNGVEYTLGSQTPTSGDVNVLMIRIGFADCPLDDGDDPADSEETLLSYFDGSPDSVNGFYETSSYGRLHLNCDKIYSCTATHDRRYYVSDDGDSGVGVNALIHEIFSGLQGELELDRYDSDGDGNLDFVCFDFAGPLTEWRTQWWPHVENSGIAIDVGSKRINVYSFLRGSVNVFTHEFGHILGAADYYSTFDSSTNSIMTYDMMSVNTGDHNGFTKWTYGWIGEDEIAYVDQESGGTAVELVPIDDGSGSGKKIAVVSPQLDRSKAYLDEYFLVEYDSGAGNNAEVFEKNSYAPGFRIFHVNAKTDFPDTSATINFLMHNGYLRSNLIHTVKNEYEDPDTWYDGGFFFREGDSLTPAGYPNTGMEENGIFNARFTGICFTDFVTGEQPSFKVSFTDERPQEEKVTPTLEYDELKADARMTLTFDTPVIPRDIFTREDVVNYQPYLTDENGTRFPLTVESIEQSAYEYELRYDQASPVLQPNTAYTLVIPEGMFRTDRTPVARFTQVVQTADFFPLTVIAETEGLDYEYLHSNLFAVTDSTYGVIRIPRMADNDCCLFTEYNLNGEQISQLEFTAPHFDPKDNNHLFDCKVYRLNDGNFAIEEARVNGYYFFRMDRRGNILSDVFAVSDELIENYDISVSSLIFEPFGSGLGVYLTPNYGDAAALLTVDFEHEPRLLMLENDGYTCFFTDNTYGVADYRDGRYHYTVYDTSGAVVSDVLLPGSFLGACEKDGNILILHYTEDPDAVYLSEYSKSGELLNKSDVTENAADLQYNGVSAAIRAISGGYYVIYDDAGENQIFLCDYEWNIIAELNLDEQAGLVFVGDCGLVRQERPVVGGTTIETISRFSLSELEIVPKRPILGDVDGDGEVTILDATYIQRKLASIPTPAFNDKAADADEDNDISILDATCIQRRLADLPSNDKIGKPIV